jgi:DNA polymerase III alpha subunit
VHDPCIYRELQAFKRRYGIFQLETWAQGTAAAKVKPKNFEQLAAVLAVARPGAIAYLQQLTDYVNEGEFTSIHPLIDDILKPTGGICVYQEQFLAMLVRVGLTPDEAEAIRKIVGKKLKEKVPEAKAKIAEVCTRNGHPAEIVDLLLQIAEDSGGYQFSSAHSVPYAKLTASTIYAKMTYPLEFFWANLQMIRHESERYEKLAVVEQEMRELGFALLPPRLSLDGMDFKIESKTTIRCALGMVRGISSENEEKLRLFIDKSGLTPQSNKFEVFQAIRNSGLHVGVGCALIQAGCMDGYEGYVDKAGKNYRSSSRLVLEFTLWSKGDLLKDKEREACMLVGEKTGWDVMNAVKHLVEVAKNEKGQPIIKESRFATIKKHYEPYKEIYIQNSRNERLACYYYERRVLGYSYSDTIGSIFGEHLDGLVTTGQARKLPPNSRCRLIGFVSDDPYRAKTKAGNDSIKFIVMDETGTIMVKAFNDRIEIIKEDNGRLPQINDLIIANVKKMEGGDVCFVERGLDGSYITIQSCKIFTRLAELCRTKAEKRVTEGTEIPSII